MEKSQIIEHVSGGGGDVGKKQNLIIEKEPSA